MNINKRPKLKHLKWTIMIKVNTIPSKIPQKIKGSIE